MTSALKGVGSKADNCTDRLREWDSDKGERVKKSIFLRASYVNGPYCAYPAVRPVPLYFA